MRVCLGFLEMKIMFRYTTSHDSVTLSVLFIFEIFKLIGQLNSMDKKVYRK